MYSQVFSINFKLRSHGIEFSSLCIYVKNVHKVRRLNPTICEIFMKMSLKIFCSASIIARGLYHHKPFCAFLKILIGHLSAASNVNEHVGRHFWHDRKN